jgi:hypothetical protein
VLGLNKAKTAVQDAGRTVQATAVIAVAALVVAALALAVVVVKESR